MKHPETLERLWKVISLVPEGSVASYGQIADLAGLPGRARLTARALAKAPQELGLPWYRIIRSSGHIAFPIGSENFAEQRAALLNEGVIVKQNKIDMRQFKWQPTIETLLFELDY